jgi:hypothetical protein
MRRGDKMAQFTVSCVEQNIWEVVVEASDESEARIKAEELYEEDGFNSFAERSSPDEWRWVVHPQEGQWNERADREINARLLVRLRGQLEDEQRMHQEACRIITRIEEELRYKNSLIERMENKLTGLKVTLDLFLDMLKRGLNDPMFNVPYGVNPDEDHESREGV